MKEIVLATRNRHKIQELTFILKLPTPLLCLDDFPPFPEPLEDGDTFEENAMKKAVETARQIDRYCLADDSGLLVDALDGRPGIYSARYADTNEKRIQRLLGELKNVPHEKRTARFMCAMCLACPDGKTFLETGTCEGTISEEPLGEYGFGYDPVFFLPQLGKTMAQLPFREKNRISHRAAAACLLLPSIEKLIDSG